MKRLAIIGSATVMSLVLSGVAIGAVSGSAPDNGVAPKSAVVPTGFVGITDGNLQSCTKEKAGCNQAEVAELAKEPWAQPLATGSALLSRGDIERLVEKSLNVAGSRTVFTALATGVEAEAITGIKRSPQIDESRLTWIVTIDTPVSTDGGPARASEVKSSYSAIIDAATGYITDDCIGCSWLTSSR